MYHTMLYYYIDARSSVVSTHPVAVERRHVSCSLTLPIAFRDISQMCSWFMGYSLSSFPSLLGILSGLTSLNDTRWYFVLFSFLPIIFFRKSYRRNLLLNSLVTTILVVLVPFPPPHKKIPLFHGKLFSVLWDERKKLPAFARKAFLWSNTLGSIAHAILVL